VIDESSEVNCSQAIHDAKRPLDPRPSPRPRRNIAGPLVRPSAPSKARHRHKGDQGSVREGNEQQKTAPARVSRHCDRQTHQHARQSTSIPMGKMITEYTRGSRPSAIRNTISRVRCAAVRTTAGTQPTIASTIHGVPAITLNRADLRKLEKAGGRSKKLCAHDLKIVHRISESSARHRPFFIRG